jgi:transcription antitermination factor NusG
MIKMKPGDEVIVIKSGSQKKGQKGFISPYHKAGYWNVSFNNIPGGAIYDENNISLVPQVGDIVNIKSGQYEGLFVNVIEVHEDSAVATVAVPLLGEEKKKKYYYHDLKVTDRPEKVEFPVGSIVSINSGVYKGFTVMITMEGFGALAWKAAGLDLVAPEFQAEKLNAQSAMAIEMKKIVKDISVIVDDPTSKYNGMSGTVTATDSSDAAVILDGGYGKNIFKKYNLKPIFNEQGGENLPPRYKDFPVDFCPYTDVDKNVKYLISKVKYWRDLANKNLANYEVFNRS